MFRKKGSDFYSVELDGHACYGDHGSDIVCAAVSSAAQLTANGITEILGVPASVEAAQDELSIKLPDNPPGNAIAFMNSLHLHLKALEEDYPENIHVSIS